MLRCIGISDIPFIIDCIRILADESDRYRAHTQNEEYVIESLTTLINSSFFIGAIQEGKGFLFGYVYPQWFCPELEAYENTFYVRPEARGSFTAFMLVRRFERLAKERGAIRMHLGESTGINPDISHRFYARLGYSLRGSAFTKRI